MLSKGRESPPTITTIIPMLVLADSLIISRNPLVQSPARAPTVTMATGTVKMKKYIASADFSHTQ
jgi:hypothetical protein